jgi:cold shock CspA family protein
MKGIVKWFNESKGYGFITSEKGEDIFCHYSSIQTTGFKNLTEGESVIFDVEPGPKGAKAINIYPQREDSEPPTQNEIPEQDYLAFALFGDKIRMVSLTADGSYRFLDQVHNLHSILYVASSETLSLEQAVDELETLVNNPKSKESDFQNFFERNPDFILNDDYKNAHSHITLTKEDGDTLIPDFVLEPLDQSSLCDLLELKLPTTDIYVLQKRRMRFSAAVLEACAQLREYSRFFDEEKNRKTIQEKFGLLAYRPKMFVIIGRRGNVSPIDVRNMQSDVPNIDLKTYDDLICRIKTRIDAMKKGKKAEN